MVVDGKKEKPYDGGGTLIFSPDSQRLAYAAKAGDKALVVVDGRERKEYDTVVTTGGGRVIFDSATSLHYLASRGNQIYLVEERLE